MLIVDYFLQLGGVISRLSKKTGKYRLYFLVDCLYCYWLYGCYPRQYEIGQFYRKRDFERKYILTYKRICKIFDIFNDPQYIHLLQDKSHFNKHFSQFIKRDWIHVKDVDYGSFIAFVRKYNEVIVKPLKDEEGHGIRKLSLPINESVYKALYDKLYEEDVMVEELIKQHPDMVFGNTSVNTIRVMTTLDSKGEVHILKAILRAGVGDTVVDNYCSGGAIYNVELSHGIVDGYGMSRVGGKHLIHPQTNIVMLGYQIPNWNILLEQIKKAAKSISQCRSIGWDIAIVEGGIELIEGNHNWDYELAEFIGDTGLYDKIMSCK